MSEFLILKKRRDFLRAAKDVTVIYQNVILQAAQNIVAGQQNPARIGFTATKKIGKATERNRMKRRLRAVVREFYEKYAKENTDYVLIARRKTLTCSFRELEKDVKRALRKINKIYIIRSVENKKNAKNCSSAD